MMVSTFINSQGISTTKTRIITVPTSAAARRQGVVAKRVKLVTAASRRHPRLRLWELISWIPSL